jgi:hypothetical protein
LIEKHVGEGLWKGGAGFSMGKSREGGALCRLEAKRLANPAPRLRLGVVILTHWWRL